jgi:photosystem II stability/assembly factor-like uncharacterized protein
MFHMARTSAPPAKQSRGRPVQTQRRRFPLVFIIMAMIIVVAALFFRQFPGTSSTDPQPISTLQTDDFHALLWSPTEPNTIFFGHHGGLLQSIDGGRSWQATTLTNADAMSVASSPKAPQRLYAAGHGIFRRSDDGGATWTAPESSIQGADIHGFAQSPADADHLFALVVGQGLLMSTDRGTTWTPQAQMDAGHAALVVSSDGKTLLMGSANRVQQSTDHGATWTVRGSGIPANAAVTALAVAHTDETIYAATTNGLYRQVTGTSAWAPTRLRGTLLAVAVNPTQPTSVLAVDDQGRVYRSDDAGMTWGS